LTLVAAGCGQDPAAAPDTGNPGPAAGDATTASGNNPPKADIKAPACPASSLVAAKLGLTIEGAADETRSNPRVNCTYKGKRLSDNQSDSVLVGLDGESGPGPYADFRKGETDQGHVVSDRAGLGDAAFTESIPVLNVTTNHLVTYKGKLRIYIGSLATFDQEADLAVAIFAQY
jgi:hypothetical protein